MAKAVIFATSFLTKKKYTPIAKYISRNANTDIFDLKDLMRLNLDAYDTIIFGSADNAGKADKLVAEFVQNNKDVLSKKKLYLYVVTKADGEKDQADAQAIAKELEVADVFCAPIKSEADIEPVMNDFISKL